MVPGFETLRTSLRASVGDIVFGMEDGNVFIFGLVFGMALSAPDSRPCCWPVRQRRSR
jgi:hypothetical protein